MIRLMKRSVGAASARWRSACAVFLVVAALPVLNACSTQPPAGMTPVSPFQIERYLGKWYEIARLDHSFERGLSDVSATYRLQDDGSVQVVNRGFDGKRNEWREAVGRALFTGDPTRASLKEPFFGPFYGGYNIVELDPNYQYVLIAGNDRDYLWLLSRTPKLDAAVQQRLVNKAKSLGFATDKLIFVKQD